ncbi:dolichyl-phosphate-mannose--protein mannosyltransferase [Sphaerimonospora thailandensis]|uniref:Polyprenol-phosphate-mannose--protein mannosyltransferase n=1 Tax=Sphaerimonospora thailandensis TaxID=795644 RepID=A0A8J3RCL5_9ACTN|nr:phospholipid carrier-dependent glycosyltransferase [Sphaerimonospora thailandensis]
MTDSPYQAFEQPEQGSQTSPGDAPDSPGSSTLSLRDRMVPPLTGDVLWGWLGPIAVAVFGAILRFMHLGTPKVIVFDETYYAKDAYSLIRFGVERQFVDGADDLVNAGNLDIFKHCEQVEQCANYVVHPPLGKWFIGLGEMIFGMNPFGWRFAAALVGSISILILARVARRMTRSTLLGCLAGFLLSLDALHFVLSRSALLDIFLMFWILAGFACLVVDRDRVRARLADWHESGSADDSRGLGPSLGLRPWRLAAGLCLGAALATKWTGLFYIAAFGIMSLLWDAGARRAAGVRRPYAGMFRRDLPLTALWSGVVPVVAYVVSFAGWFVSGNGYGRDWAEATSGGPIKFVFSSLGSLYQYQYQILTFHEGLQTTHPYQSQPWSWPLLLKPVAFFYEQPANCGAPSCSWAVLGTGTPVIWYGGLIALIGLITWYVASRDWRAAAVLVGYGAGWLPWFYFAIADNRTMFLFYMMPMIPFMILAIVLGLGLLIGRVGASQERRLAGIVGAGVFALLALANFWWLYPVIAAQIVPYDDWYARMLFRSWV